MTMEFKEALKNAGESEGKILNVQMNRVAQPDSFGILRWLDEGTLVMVIDITEGNWLPHHEAKEIRPDQGGELWSFENQLDGADYIFIMEGNEAGQLILIDSTGESTAEIPLKMIHGKNGWTLIYSPDKEVMKKIKKPEDDSVERIEIEGVKWKKADHGKFGEGVIPEFSSMKEVRQIELLQNKPPMKMILEIPKI
jgi:hypothetical protein